ncbi:MAG TPA: hypothetical protein VF024_18505 [Solirubrobacteraceae bacterium]
MPIVGSAWIVVALAVAGCAGTAAAPQHARTVAPARTVRAHGLTAELPPGWQAAAESLTPHLTDPREELAVGTYSLRYRQTECAHVPGSALEDLGPGDAFVTLQERGLGVPDGEPDFPSRPSRFGPALGGPSEAGACAPGARFSAHWFGFSDGGRRFHVLVAFGPQASVRVQRQAWAILDGLRVDPGVVPDWQSSG